MEQKLLPQFTKSIEDRTVTGIFCVHGNIDEGRDRSWPGSFSNIAINGRNRAKFLWMHRSEDPPIAVIESIRELSRPALPEAVLGYAPDASGAVEVARRYLTTPRANEVLEGLKEGAIDEMSYAYDVTRSDFEEVDGVQVRNIREVKLYDISDVTWGLNPATVGVKSKLLGGLTLVDHFETVLEAVEELTGRYESLKAKRIDGVRSGRVFSAAHEERLRSIKESAIALVAMVEEMLAALEPKADPQKARRLYAEFQRLEATFNGVQP